MDAKYLLGQRLKAYRTKMGLSMEEMAFRCDLHASYFTLLENGKRNPNLATLEKIAMGLGIPLAELLNFDKEPNITIFDQTTNKIVSTVNSLTLDEKEQALIVMNALARISRNNRENGSK